MTRHLLKLVWNRRRHHLLVGLEILASFLIVFVVAVLAVKTAGNAARPAGFISDDVTVVEVGLRKRGGGPAGDAGADRERMRRALETLRRLEGVEAAAAAFLVPYGTGRAVNSHSVNGRALEYDYSEVTDDYLAVTRLKLAAGRWFSREDDGRPYRPVVVTRELAREAFGAEDPVGKDIPEGGVEPGTVRRRSRVVGVLEAYRPGSDYAAPAPFALFRADLASPADDVPSRIVLRLRPGTPRAFEETLVRTLEAAVPEWSFTAEPLAVAREAANRRWTVPILAASLVAAFLMLLVALGLTGVLWQNVSRRTREIGLRRATGATARQVAAQVVMEVWIVTALAVLAGSAFALQAPLVVPFGLLRFAEVLAAAALASLLLFALTGICALYPAWLAARVDPSESLRWE